MLAPAPAPEGAAAPLQPTGLVLAPAPALAADVNSVVGAVNAVAADSPRPRNAAQPPALPALPPQARAPQ